jgi:hypothetical protein
MDDVKKFILSLAEAGLYKARLEEEGKEYIYADNKFTERNIPVKARAFEDTEELAVGDLDKKKKPAAVEEKKKPKAAAPPKEKPKPPEAEPEEPESYRVAPSKKLFRAAIFIVPVLAAAVIFLLSGIGGKKEKDIGLDAGKTDTVVAGEKSADKTVPDLKTGAEDGKSGEISGQETPTDNVITDKTQGSGQDSKSAVTTVDMSAAKPPVEIKDSKTVSGKDTKMVPGETKKQPAETQKTSTDLKKPGEQTGKKTIKPDTLPLKKTVKIVELPSYLTREYNTEFSKLVINYVPTKIKVSGYLNVKAAIDDKGKVSVRISSSEGLQVTPEDTRDKLLNLIKTKISSLRFTPPLDKQNNPVSVSEFNIDYQVGKLESKLILKKK